VRPYAHFGLVNLSRASPISSASSASSVSLRATITASFALPETLDRDLQCRFSIGIA